jgi:hypothetical protein
MPDLALQRAEEISEKSDLSLVLGTTMKVEPSASLAARGRRHHQNFKLVIVNLQPTDRDYEADLRIYSTTDNVFKLLMEELQVDIPQYKNLDLGNNKEWLQDFNANYHFRSPSSTWYTGPEDPTILKPNADQAFLDSVTVSPKGRHLARAIKDIRATEEKEVSLRRGELLEVLRIQEVAEGKSWCFVVVVNRNTDQPIRMGYVFERDIAYI